MTSSEIPKQFGDLNELVRWHGLETSRGDLQGLQASLDTIARAEQQAYADPNFHIRKYGDAALQTTVEQPKQEGENDD